MWCGSRAWEQEKRIPQLLRAVRDTRGEWGLEVSEAALQAVARLEGLRAIYRLRPLDAVLSSGLCGNEQT